MALLGVCSHIAFQRHCFHTDKRYTFKNVFVMDASVTTLMHVTKSGVTFEVQEDSQRSEIE